MLSAVKFEITKVKVFSNTNFTKNTHFSILTFSDFNSIQRYPTTISLGAKFQRPKQ